MCPACTSSERQGDGSASAATGRASGTSLSPKKASIRRTTLAGSIAIATRPWPSTAGLAGGAAENVEVIA